DMINRAYIEIMMAGDAKGRVFTFPIPTYNITEDFDWHSENAERLFEMTARYGLPYFQNFINSELKPNMIRSMCCRLQLDLRELLKRGNGLFGSAEQTGSLGVVTINCARLGHLWRGDEPALMADLDRLLELGKTSLEIKRRTIVFISHDLDEAMRIGDRVAIMKDGHVVQVGTPEEILRKPANDYVRNFVRGVDAAAVFKASDIARKSQIVVSESPSRGSRAALSMLEEQ
ncbi:MAG: anaerobic ribonucleoside-triphosphate reductase, partial [Janthinobacterium sp.]